MVASNVVVLLIRNGEFDDWAKKRLSIAQLTLYTETFLLLIIIAVVVVIVNAVPVVYSCPANGLRIIYRQACLFWFGILQISTQFDTTEWRWVGFYQFQFSTLLFLTTLTCDTINYSLGMHTMVHNSAHCYQVSNIAIYIKLVNIR